MNIVKLLILISMMINLTGCWSKIELNELTFIYGVYVDTGKEPGTIEVSISSPLPNQLRSESGGGAGGGGGKSYTLVTKTAHTVPEALVLIQKDLTRRIDVSHIKVIIIGKDYARQGIEDLLEWCGRQPEFPLGAFIMEAPGRARAVFNLSPQFEQLPDQVLMNLAKEKYMLRTTVKDCMLSDASNMGYAMNQLSFGKSPEIGGLGKEEYWAGVQGVSLFQNATEKGTLNVEEGRNLAWAAGSLNLPLYNISWEEEGGNGRASALFLSGKSSRHVRMTSDGPEFQIKVKGHASIIFYEDSQGRSAYQLGTLIKTKLEEKAEKEISKAIRAAQESKVDALHLGLLVEWNHPKAWKKLRERWPDYYAEHVEVSVKADFVIEDFGSER